MSLKSDSRRCSGTTAKGEPCRAWAVPNSEPPLCAAHQGKAGGAPAGNQNRLVHGAYAPLRAESDLAEVIKALKRTLARIEAVMEACQAEELQSWAELQGRISSRIGRLERDQQALGGGGEGGDFWDEVAEAIELLRAEHGIDLLDL